MAALSRLTPTQALLVERSVTVLFFEGFYCILRNYPRLLAWFSHIVPLYGTVLVTVRDPGVGAMYRGEQRWAKSELDSIPNRMD